MFAKTATFQFQYGAIERYEIRLPSDKEMSFQFQYGAIERRKGKGDLGLLRQFQFQYGAIERQMYSELRCEFCVSIPIWCD